LSAKIPKENSDSLLCLRHQAVPPVSCNTFGSSDYPQSCTHDFGLTKRRQYQVMLLMVSKTIEHPKLPSGFVNLSSIVDVVGSLKNQQPSRRLKIYTSPLTSAVPSDTAIPFHGQGHKSASQLHPAQVDADLTSLAQPVRKQILQIEPYSASKRYRWYMPAGLFRYLAISWSSHITLNIKRHS
jgi:hypothetical protein